MRQAVLRRPSFEQHFDGLVLDWTHLVSRSAAALQADAAWCAERGLSEKARAKIVSKYTTTSNVDREMKASVKHKGHQSLRRERPARKVDLEKRARLAREPSPDEPRPDGKFVFKHSERRGRAARR